MGGKDLTPYLRALYRTPGLFVGLLDGKGRLLDANGAALDFIERELKEVKGKRFWKTPWWDHSTKLQERLREGLVRARRGQTVRFEADHYSPGGEKITVEFILRAVEERGNRLGIGDGEVDDSDVTLLALGRDVTEREEMERQLKRERDLFKQLAETSPVAIAEVDRSGTIVYANGRAEEVLGLTKSEIRGRTYDDPEWEITDFEGGDYPSERLPFQLVKETEEPVYDVRHAIEWPNGERKLLAVNGSPLFDEEGNFEGMVAVIQDVTEEVRTNERLKASERRYRKLVQNINDAVIVCEAGEGEEFVIKEFNEAAEEIERVDRKDVLGESFAQSFPRAEESGLLEVLRRVRETGQSESYSLAVEDEGRLDFYVNNYVYRLPAGEVVVVYEDVTEEKRAQRREEHLNSVLRSIRDVNQLLVKVKDRRSLIEGVCDNLVETRDFHSAWIALFDESGELTMTAERGWGEDFEPMRARLASGPLPPRVRKTLQEPGVMATGKPPSTCADCPLAGRYEGRGSIAIGLEHGGKIYGLLAVSTPVRFVNDEEEQALLEEVAGDIAYGLHDLEVEEKRKRAEKKFRRAVQYSPHPTMIHAEDGEVITINNVWSELTGYKQEEIPTIADWTKKAYGESKNDVRDDIKELYERDARSEEGEYEISTKYGEKRVWEFSSAPLSEGPAGRRLVLSVAKDVTARRRAEEELRESEKRYRALFRNTGAATCILEADATISLVNEQAEELSGYSKEEIEGEMKWTEFVADEDLERMKEYHERRLKDPGAAPRQYEFKFLTRSGESRDVLVTIGTIEGTKKSIASLVDITERKKAVEAERRMAQRIKAGLRAGNLAWWEMEFPSGAVTFNDKKAEMLGYSPERFQTYEDFTELLHPEDHEETMGAMRDHLEGEAENYEVEYRLETRKGNYKWFRDVGRITETGKDKGEDEDSVRVVGIVQDITERKEARKKLEESEAKLRQSFVELAETTSRVLGVRDPYTQRHEQRVAQLAREVGGRMGLGEDRLLGLYLGGVLHDIGKIAIPETILTKPGELSEIEWKMIHSHPKVGYDEILEGTDFSWPVAEMTLHHHERLDGSGYPDGLEGDELSLEVRILGAVDVVEAMSTRRPYREARSKEQVLSVLKEEKGDKLDSRVVDILLEMIDEGEIEFG